MPSQGPGQHFDWGDVDLRKKTVHIQRTFTDEGVEIERLKTQPWGFSDYCPPALAALKDQKSYTGRKGAEVFQYPVKLNAGPVNASSEGQDVGHTLNGAHFWADPPLDLGWPETADVRTAADVHLP